MKPFDIYELELWEYNSYILGYTEGQRQNVANSILNGYYTAYYLSGQKKKKSPQELISRMFAEKQTFEEGLAQIEKIKEMEKGRKALSDDKYSDGINNYE